MRFAGLRESQARQDLIAYLEAVSEGRAPANAQAGGMMMSMRGPFPGKPVMVGAGMHGDRASVVFAAPGEISRLVKWECREDK
jgi:hypothetical protein